MIKIGTRGSKLAQRQADSLTKILDQKELDYSITIYKNENIESEIQNSSKAEGASYSVKEINDALLKEEIDIAVHPLNKLAPKKMEGLVTA